jgi:hypothetical protein
MGKQVFFKLEKERVTDALMEKAAWDKEGKRGTSMHSGTPRPVLYNHNLFLFSMGD